MMIFEIILINELLSNFPRILSIVVRQLQWRCTIFYVHGKYVVIFLTIVHWFTVKTARGRTVLCGHVTIPF